MPRPLRYIPMEAKSWTDSRGQKIAVVEITIRAKQGRFLLRPSPEVRDVIVGAMAHAQRTHEFDVYGYSFLSNHGSYLVGVTDPKHQAAIMQSIHSKIGIELRRPEFSDWQGGIIERRGRPILVANEEDLVSRLKYCLANSTKEHLVTRPDRWGGAHAAKALCGQGNGIHGRFMEDQGIYYNRTLCDTLKRGGMPASRALKESTEKVTLKLSKLPCWAEMSDDEYRNQMVSICTEITREAAQVRREEGGKVLGMARALRYHPHHRPDKTDSSPAPMIHCSCPNFRALFIEGYRAFVECYREAMSKLQDALGPVFFPYGGIPPG